MSLATESSIPPPPLPISNSDMTCRASPTSFQRVMQRAPVAASLARSSQKEQRRLDVLLASEVAPEDYVQTIQAGAVSAMARAECLAWLYSLRSSFSVESEVFFQAVNIVDRFLAAIRIKPKHLHIISAVGFWIACKFYQDGGGPSAQEIIDCCDKPYTESDFCRMETIMLTKLKWKIQAPTPQDFLICLWESVTVADLPCIAQRTGLTAIPEDTEVDFTPKKDHSILRGALSVLERCVIQYDIVQFRPAVLALAALFQQLENRFGKSAMRQQVAFDLAREIASTPDELNECVWRISVCGQLSLPALVTYDDF